MTNIASVGGAISLCSTRRPTSYSLRFFRFIACLIEGNVSCTSSGTFAKLLMVQTGSPTAQGYKICDITHYLNNRCSACLMQEYFDVNNPCVRVFSDPTFY